MFKGMYQISISLSKSPKIGVKSFLQVSSTKSPSEDQWTWLPSSNSMPNATFLRPRDLGKTRTEMEWIIAELRTVFSFWLNINIARYDNMIVVHLNVEALALALHWRTKLFVLLTHLVFRDTQSCWHRTLDWKPDSLTDSWLTGLSAKVSKRNDMHDQKVYILMASYYGSIWFRISIHLKPCCP